MKTLLMILITLIVSPQTYAIDEADQKVNIDAFKTDAWLSPPKFKLSKEIKQKYLDYGDITANIRFFAGTEGKIQKVILIRSSGYSDIDQIILDGFNRARTKPFIENGVAYPITAIQPVSINF
ncbi:energy transducer TonB [Acinetobacter venetianus]|uniref:energy transducer TonB n=1 Tax=Acinetobacter venetianus TaxID=52133 RepID=UPI00037C03AB|nr:hypothetical protein [Acinetobacter venetianus]MCR4529319.1 energy transducer TonB [Acinetobacter venetianus]MDA0697661.1 hypothetical protein [Pseudomonadota bacterium]MDA1255055.1 hypothetical protein [Pseudomonadota bacterium]